MTWQEVALRDCVTFLSGGTPSKRNTEYWKGDIPWVSSGEMTRQFINDTTLHISEVAAVEGSRLVPEGAIFAVVRGMSLATEFRVSYATRRMAFNQDLKGLLVKDGVDSYFLFSSLRAHANQIRELATEAAHGTKKLEMERLESFRIKIPNITLQQQIAGVVRNYDDLIEGNRRRIALLEESARLLYCEWFVKLRFPGHESAKWQDGLPEGWKKCYLKDIATLNYGKALKESDRITGDVPVYGSSGIVGTHNKPLIDSPVIILGRKGNVGSVFFSDVPCFAIDTVYFISGSEVNYYLFQLLQTMNFISSDSAVPGLNRNYAYGLEVLYPDSSTLTRFEEAVAPVFQQISLLNRQNIVLQNARDELLPKLMSGAIQV